MEKEYNIDKLTENIVKEALNEFNDLSYKEISSKLGISERTLYRYMIKYKLIKESCAETKAKELLIKKGYIITK